MPFPATQWPNHFEFGSSRLRDEYPRPPPSATSTDVNLFSAHGLSPREGYVRSLQTSLTASPVYRPRREDTSIPFDRAMNDTFEHNPPLPHTPSSLLSLPTGVSPALSPDHSDGPTLLEPLDKPIRFLQEFRNLNALRQRVQNLRVRARDERERMKLTRRRLLTELTSIIRRGQNATEQLRSLEKIQEELDSQETSYDFLESDLIPAEFKLKETEQILYEDILGDAAFEQSDADLDTWVIPSPLPNLPFADATADILARQAELTPRERLLALESADGDLRRELANLESTYETLLQHAELQVAAGVPVDPSSQDFIDSYLDRRGSLLRQLASVAEAKDTVASSPINVSESNTAADALFRCDQFADVDTDASPQTADSNDDETLSLSDGDFGAWRDDLTPLLARPVLDAGGVVDVTKPLPTHPDSQYSDSAGNVADGLATFVSKWILQCVRSSWWSLTQFVSTGYVVDNWSYKTMEKYLFQTWVWDDDFSVFHFRPPGDLESLHTSQLPEEKSSSWSEDEQTHMQRPKKHYRAISLFMRRLDRHVFHSSAHTQ